MRWHCYSCDRTVVATEKTRTRAQNNQLQLTTGNGSFPCPLGCLPKEETRAPLPRSKLGGRAALGDQTARGVEQKELQALYERVWRTHMWQGGWGTVTTWAGVQLTGPRHQHGTEGDPCCTAECQSWHNGKHVGVAESKRIVRSASKKVGWVGIRSLGEQGVVCV